MQWNIHLSTLTQLFISFVVTDMHKSSTFPFIHQGNMKNLIFENLSDKIGQRTKKGKQHEGAESIFIDLYW